jgi:hypothetical protein
MNISEEHASFSVLKCIAGLTGCYTYSQAARKVITQNHRQGKGHRSRWHVPLKHWYPYTRLHGVITQKTII